VRFKGGNVELIAPGTISIKFGNYSQMGPASMTVPQITFPLPPDFCLECWLKARLQRKLIAPVV
jgi:uncharacterized protein (DUF2345 family)